MNLVRGKTLGTKVGGGCCQATGVDFLYFLYGCQPVLLCTSMIAFCPHTPSPPLAAVPDLYNKHENLPCPEGELYAKLAE